MLAMTEWVCSAGSRFRDVSCRNVEITAFWPPARTIRPGSRVLHPGLGGVSLEPVERPGDGAIVGVDDARIPADERNQGHGLGRREGEVAPGPVVNLSLPGPAAKTPPGAVGHIDPRVPPGTRPDRLRPSSPKASAPLPAQALEARCSAESFA